VRRALAFGLAALALAGCESTQDKSARLKAAAKNRPQEKAFVVTERNPDIRIGARTVLRGAGGAAAVVLELRSRAKAPQGRVPVSFELLDAKGERVYRNDTPGLDASLVEAPLIPPRGTLAWVDDQIEPERPAHSARARVGLPKATALDPPRIDVGRLRVEQDPVSGAVVEGSVRNRSAVEQKRLVVFVVARRGGRIVGAGRAIVPRLKAHDDAKFNAFLIGDVKRARLTAAAPPTTLVEPTS
jgi:hypothetical protein